MDQFALLGLLEAKPGKEQEVEAFLKSALPLAQRETATTSWYAVKLGPGRFGIFDTFRDEAGRERSGFVRCGASFFGPIFSDDAEVRWKCEPSPKPN